ncbi:MAG: cytochrome c [Candidatus Brocadiaceae bacterium]|nr:cytochrome c [Candidatus Brocadiaceae bacterium]
MKKNHFFLGMIVFSILLSYGCDSKSTVLSDKGGIWEVYDRECVKCHKVNGRSSFIGRLLFKVPDFTDTKWQDNASDSRLIIHVANGLRKMPGFKGKLKDDEIVDLVKICVRSYYPPLE